MSMVIAELVKSRSWLDTGTYLFVLLMVAVLPLYVWMSHPGLFPPIALVLIAALVGRRLLGVRKRVALLRWGKVATVLEVRSEEIFGAGSSGVKTPVATGWRVDRHLHDADPYRNFIKYAAQPTMSAEEAAEEAPPYEGRLFIKGPRYRGGVILYDPRTPSVAACVDDFSSDLDCGPDGRFLGGFRPDQWRAGFLLTALTVGWLALIAYVATTHHVPFLAADGGASQPPAPTQHAVESPVRARARPDARPQAIPPPTTLPRTVLRDEFSDPKSGWALKTAHATWSYEDDELHVVATRQGSYWNLIPLPNTDVTVDVDVTARRAEGFGIVCRATKHSKHFYALLATSWDEFAVDDYFDMPIATATSTPAGMSYSELDRLGKSRVTTHLHAECIGSAQRLYVDGKARVAAADPWKQSGDEVGLMVVAKKGTDNDFVFDNLVIQVR